MDPPPVPDIVDLERTISHLRAACDTALTSLETYSKAYEHLQDQHKSQGKKLSHAEKEIALAQAEESQAKKENQDKELALSNAYKKIARVQADETSTRQELVKLKLEHSKEIKKLEKVDASRKRENEKLEKSNSKLTEDVLSYMKELKSLRLENPRLKTERSSLNRKIAQGKKELDQELTRIAALEEALGEKNTRILELEREIRDVEALANHWKEKSRQFEDKADAYAHRTLDFEILDSIKKALADERVVSEKLASEVADFKESFGELQAQHEDLQEEVDKLDENIKILESETCQKAKRKELDDMKGRILYLEDELAWKASLFQVGIAVSQWRSGLCYLDLDILATLRWQSWGFP